MPRTAFLAVLGIFVFAKPSYAAQSNIWSPEGVKPEVAPASTAPRRSFGRHGSGFAPRSTRARSRGRGDTPSAAPKRWRDIGGRGNRPKWRRLLRGRQLRRPYSLDGFIGVFVSMISPQRWQANTCVTACSAAARADRDHFISTLHGSSPDYS